MAEIINNQSKPEDFIQNGMEFTYVWNPRIVTDEGQGSWTIQPKEKLVFTQERPPLRLFDDLSISTNSGTAPAPEAASAQPPAPALAPERLLSGQSDLTFPNLTLDTRNDAPASAPAAAPSAPTSVLGMFPEVEAMQRALYQQKQNEAMQAQAMQFASLSPMARAQYSLYMGGQQLGDAIGSALGGKDPQLQLISMRNAISRQIDMRSPESYYKAATLANQAGDTEFATSLVNVGNKLELDTSLIQQRTREKQAADPIQQLLRTGKFTAASVAKYETSKNISDLREADSPDKIPARIQEAKKVATSKGFPEGTAEHDAEVVNYLEKSEKEPSVGSDREAIAKDMFFKPFSQLTQEQIKAVNAKKKADDLDAAKATVPSSGIKEYKDIPKLRADIISTIKPFRDTVNATDFALENLDLSIKQNNFSAFNAARVQLAKSLAGGDLSQKEIQAAGGDPSIIGGLVDMASTAFSGTPSTDTQEKIKATIKAIRKVALQKGRAELEVQRTLAKRSNFTDEDFDLASDIPEFRKKPSLKTTESDDALVNKYLTKKP